jgi:hypothetical protein
MVLVGIRIVTAYGQSWDEYNNYTYGEKSLNSYTNGTFLQDQGEDYFHGTFYFMLFSVTSRFFSDLIGQWSLVDGRHFTNYLAFLGTAFWFYLLAFRLMDRLWATITMLIFLTQPLYFGHSFINPKDIPFMALFLASVTTGLFASDLWGKAETLAKTSANPRSPSTFFVSLLIEWRQTSLWQRIVLLFLILVGVLVTTDLFVQRWIYPGLQNVLVQVYEGQTIPVISTLFTQFAGQAADFPLEGYFVKLRNAYLWLRLPLVGLAFFPTFVFATQILPNTYQKHIRLRLVQYRAWGIAGVLLGLTGSVRIFGPFAGLLVTLYAIYNHRRRAIPPLVSYWILQGGITYLTWPTLWGNPVGKLWERLLTASDFDPNILLFEGQHILSSQTPRLFIPKLMTLQFTEPVLLLFLLGFVLVVLDLRKNRENRLFVGLLLLWFLLPVGAQILLQTTVYDNFRHFFFATPPLFLFVGYGLMRSVNALNRKFAWVPVVLLVVLPGIIPIFRYHPYEYTYFNSIVGGVSGAYERYELDYWCTSYREAMDVINSNAPKGTAVLVLGPDEAAREFARSDLTVVAEDASILILDNGETVREFPREDLVSENIGSGKSEIAYVLTCTSATRGLPHQPDLPVIFEIRRGDAVFTSVKSVP